jgi:hypothetical protein|tara:strand:- start:1598 stop:1840 length:243 start_codon:yes stop_codon:yes gene_type:complete
LEFSHSLDNQISGQVEVGFNIDGFYKNTWDDDATSLNAYMPTSIAMLAIMSNGFLRFSFSHKILIRNNDSNIGIEDGSRT